MPTPPIQQLFLTNAEASTLPLWLVSESTLDQWRASQPLHVAHWLAASTFKAERHRVLLLPAPDGAVAGAVLGLGRLNDLAELSFWHTTGIGDKLPPADFRFATAMPAAAAAQAALGFAYGEYRFERYRLQNGPQNSRGGSPRRGPRLSVPPGCDLALIERTVQALGMARDLINTPASDLGPAELAAAAQALAERYGAQCRVLEGEALLEHRYPAIHAVGRASSRAPRLIDMSWGTAPRPRVTLIGKGVCFDSGGLDLKTSQSMQLMKKDMGGAACVLALAQMVMDAKLELRLRVLIPAVENSIGGNAYRPGDVLATRKGLTVEVGNTDAEGRLVLCDALAEADGEQPDLIIDLATLTGAARVALGPELPALYGNHPSWVEALVRQGQAHHDPVWPMPLWSPYDEELASKIADLNNMPASSLAGSITAALFLRRFVSERTPWLHLDLFAWNIKDRPGRPVGAEAQCVRALYALLEEKYG
jgi:leucyl aminopeptidase